MCDDSIIISEVSSLCSSVERLSIRTWAEAPDFYDVTTGGKKKITELCSINYSNPGWGGEQADAHSRCFITTLRRSTRALSKANTKKMDALKRLTY